MKRYIDPPKEGDFRVWHIPQVPGKPFLVSVVGPKEGKRLMDVLAQYDMFQLLNNIKPDYSNANGLDVYEDGKWVTWYNKDGYDIDSLYFDKHGKLVDEPDED